MSLNQFLSITKINWILATFLYEIGVASDAAEHWKERKPDAPFHQPITAALRSSVSADWLRGTSSRHHFPPHLANSGNAHRYAYSTWAHKSGEFGPEKRERKRNHGANERKERAPRRVCRLPFGFQILRHGCYPRRPGAGAVVVHGCGSSDIPVHYLQAALTGKPRRK